MRTSQAAQELANKINNPAGIRNLTAGAMVQNPISYASFPERARVNNMLVTPTLTYNFSHGWFAGLSEFNMTWDWENGGAATVPLGIQAGRVFHIGGRPFLASIEAGRTVARPARTPNPSWANGEVPRGWNIPCTHSWSIV